MRYEIIYEIQQRLVVGWWIRQERQADDRDEVRFQGWGSNCSTQRRDNSNSACNEIFPQARLATTAVARPHEQQQQEPRAKSQVVVAVHARVEDEDPHHPLCCARRKERQPEAMIDP